MRTNQRLLFECAAKMIWNGQGNPSGYGEGGLMLLAIEQGKINPHAWGYFGCRYKTIGGGLGPVINPVVVGLGVNLYYQFLLEKLRVPLGIDVNLIGGVTRIQLFLGFNSSRLQLSCRLLPIRQELERIGSGRSFEEVTTNIIDVKIRLMIHTDTICGGIPNSSHHSSSGGSYETAHRCCVRDARRVQSLVSSGAEE